MTPSDQRRALLPREPRDERNRIVSRSDPTSHAEFDVRDGVVTSTKLLQGVYVDIGEARDAQLHVSHISSERISAEDFLKMFSVGDKIKVMVQRIAKSGLISVSTKSLEVNPGDMIKSPQLVYEKAEEGAAASRAKFEAQMQEKEALKNAPREIDPNLKVHEVHELRSGVVTSVRKFGVFVDIGDGSSPFTSVGMLHVSRISSEFISEEDLKTIFSLGDKIKVMIHYIDQYRKLVSLSTRSLEVNPGDMARDPQLVYEKAEEVAAAYRVAYQAAKEAKKKAARINS
eukprot:gene24337-biopygen18801